MSQEEIKKKFDREEFDILGKKIIKEIENDSIDENWTFLKETKKIKIYKKKSENSEIHQIRGDTIVDIPAKDFFNFAKGIETVETWNDHWKNGHFIHKFDSNNELYYFQFSTGVPFISTRDFITFESRSINNGTYIISTISVGEKYLDERAKKKINESNCIRGEIFPSGYVIKEIDENSCSVIWIGQGWIPTWVVNMMSIDEPLTILVLRDTFLKLKSEGKSYEDYIKNYDV